MLKNHGKNSEFLRSEAKSLLGTRVHFAQTLSGDALPPFPCVSAVYLQPLTLYLILEGKEHTPNYLCKPCTKPTR